MTRREFAKVGAAALALSATANAAPWLDASRQLTASAAPRPPSLPQPLIFDSGRPVENRTQWPRRHAEILHTAAVQMYGTAPSPAGLHFVVQEKGGPAFGGKALWRQVQLYFKPGTNSPTANLLLYTPRHIPRAPVIVGLNFWGNHTLSNDPEELLPTSWVESGRNIFADLSCVVDHRAPRH